MLERSDLEKLAGDLAMKVHDVYDVKRTSLQAQLIYEFILETLINVQEGCKEGR